jgi:hypothetical protein
VRAFGREHAAIEQRRDAAPRRAFARSQEGGDIAAGQLAPEENRLEDLARLRRKRSRANLFVRPDLNPVTQAIWLY